jgi:hypothetical protein
MGRELPPPAGEFIYDADGVPIGYRSRYGIHTTEIPYPPRTVINPALARLTELTTAARKELATAGEQTDEQVIATYNGTMPADALLKWASEVGRRSFEAGSGFHSRRVMAAQFLARLSRVKAPSLPPRQPGFDEVAQLTRLSAVCSFAAAWHLWHMEVFGEHGAAYSGQLTSDSLRKGPAAIKARQEARRSAILSVVGELLGEGRPCSFIAKNRYEKVNAALAIAGQRAFRSVSALSRELERIRGPRASSQDG